MSEFVKRIRFLAAGQHDPQSIALSNCADRIEVLEKALEDVIIYSDDDTAIKTARAALEGKDE
jgi:hypothetical protein